MPLTTHMGLTTERYNRTSRTLRPILPQHAARNALIKKQMSWLPDQSRYGGAAANRRAAAGMRCHAIGLISTMQTLIRATADISGAAGEDGEALARWFRRAAIAADCRLLNKGVRVCHVRQASSRITAPAVRGPSGPGPVVPYASYSWPDSSCRPSRTAVPGGRFWYRHRNQPCGWFPEHGCGRPRRP
jgi:hypothetical protein